MTKKVFQVMSYKELRPRQVLKNPAMLEKYDGWYVSIKYDGWQAIWTGKKLVSKTGKREFSMPEYWKQYLPQHPMVGELMIKTSKGFKPATSIANLLKKDADWSSVIFMAFDLPINKVSFEERTRRLAKIVTHYRLKNAFARNKISNPDAGPIAYIPQTKISSKKIIDFYQRAIRKGEEGIVLTNPESFYLTKKSADRVKLKGRADLEGRLLGFNVAQDGHMKSMKIKYKNMTFNLGIGFKILERENYKKLFKIGNLIKFSYRSFGTNGRPKEARFLSIRHDADYVDSDTD